MVRNSFVILLNISTWVARNLFLFCACLLITPPGLQANSADARIAIVGAGAAGLSAAHQLKKLGYDHIVIYEKEAQVGGKARTLTLDGHKIELGTLFFSNRYKNLLALAEEFNLPVDTFQSRFMFYDHSGKKVPYKGYTGSSLYESFLGINRFRKLRNNLSLLNQPGFANIENEDVLEPMSSFAHDYEFQSIFAPFDLILVGFGYGYMDQVPALYPLKLMDLLYDAGLNGIIEITKLKFSYPLSLPYPSGLGMPGVSELFSPSPYMTDIMRLTNGSQSLWEEMAKQFGDDVRLSSPVTHVKRHCIDEKCTIDVQSQNNIEQYDKLIVATPLDVALHYLGDDASQIEQDLFRRVKYINYKVTVFRSETLPKSETVFFQQHLTSDRRGHIVAYLSYYEDSNIFIAYQQADWVDPSQQEQQMQDLRETLHEDLQAIGGSVDEILYEKLWNHFPHFETPDIENGIYQKLEDLQGVKGTYYVGSIMNFDTIETTIEFSYDLMKRHF